MCIRRVLLLLLLLLGLAVAQKRPRGFSVGGGLLHNTTTYVGTQDVFALDKKVAFYSINHTQNTLLRLIHVYL